MNDHSELKLTAADVLEALGLERRHAKGRDVAMAVGFATVGALFGAGFVLMSAGLRSMASKPVQPEAAES